MSPPHSVKKQGQTGLRINISKLSEGIHDYRFNVEPILLTLDERFTTTLDIKARLDKSSNQIYLTTTIETDINVECDRCLTPFVHHILTSYSILYTTSEYHKQQQNMVDWQLISVYQPYLDITEEVREYLLLALPVKLLCNTECAGLCPGCGKNMNEEKCNCNID